MAPSDLQPSLAQGYRATSQLEASQLHARLAAHSSAELRYHTALSLSRAGRIALSSLKPPEPLSLAAFRHNSTNAPGWTDTDRELLVILLKAYGVGNWKEIIETNLLPGKKITQLNGQTQRLLGTQSVAGTR